MKKFIILIVFLSAYAGFAQTQSLTWTEQYWWTNGGSLSPTTAIGFLNDTVYYPSYTGQIYKMPAGVRYIWPSAGPVWNTGDYSFMLRRRIGNAWGQRTSNTPFSIGFHNSHDTAMYAWWYFYTGSFVNQFSIAKIKNGVQSGSTITAQVAGNNLLNWTEDAVLNDTIACMVGLDAYSTSGSNHIENVHIYAINYKSSTTAISLFRTQTIPIGDTTYGVQSPMQIAQLDGNIIMIGGNFASANNTSAIGKQIYIYKLTAAGKTHLLGLSTANWAVGTDYTVDSTTITGRHVIPMGFWKTHDYVSNKDYAYFRIFCWDDSTNTIYRIDSSAVPVAITAPLPKHPRPLEFSAFTVDDSSHTLAWLYTDWDTLKGGYKSRIYKMSPLTSKTDSFYVPYSTFKSGVAPDSVGFFNTMSIYKSHIYIYNANNQYGNTNIAGGSTSMSSYDNSGGGALQASWTPMGSLVVDTPKVGYYAVGDSNHIAWHTFSGDSVFKVWIDYGNGYNFVDSVVSKDSLVSIPFVYDSVSSGATVRVADIALADTNYSPTFIITPAKYLKIDTVMFNSGRPSTMSVVITHHGIFSIKTLIGKSVNKPDSILLALDTPPNPYIFDTDTTLYTLSAYDWDSLYVEALEMIDTTAYGYTDSLLMGPVSAGYNMTQFCTTWALYGTGIRWLTDVSCGWAPTVTWTNGQSSLGVTGDSLYATLTYEGNAYPHTILTYPIPTDNWSQSSFFVDTVGVLYDGRLYFMKGGYLYMTDEVNNITYQINSNHINNSLGIIQIGGKIVVITLPYSSAYLFSAITYPNDKGYTPIKDVKLVMNGSQAAIIQIFRNYFRGIYPKALLSAYPPEGK